MGLTKFVLKFAVPVPKIESFERYLFVGPHPDDIEIGAGATAAKLAKKEKDFAKADSIRAELMEKGISFVREVYDYAEQKGVRAIYEDQGFVFNGVDGFGEFLNKVNRNVGVVADFGNIFQSGDCIEDFVKAFHDRFVHAHIKDVNVSDVRNATAFPALGGKFVDYVSIGSGQIDIKGVIKLLDSYGYDGYYGIEYAVSSDDESHIIRKIFEL